MKQRDVKFPKSVNLYKEKFLGKDENQQVIYITF